MKLSNRSVSADDSRLILLDDLELKSYIPSSSWDLVVQNPFKGAIEIAESPVDKFQILINVTNGLSSNQKINYLLRNTDDAVYVELDASLKCSKNANQDSYLRPGSLEDPELIELLPTHLDSELKQQSNDQRTSSQLCASPPNVGLSIDPTSDLGTHGATSTCPTGYPIPRYVIAGGVSTNVTYGQSPLTESNMLGRTPILISANAAGLLSSPPDGTSSPPVAYVRLAPQSGTPMVSDAAAKFTSNMLSGGDHNSLRVHTLPGRRHVAKEFLDESVMATMTRSRGKAYAAHTSSALTGNRSIVSQPIPEATTLTGQATQPALLSLHTPLVFVPGVSGENISSLDSAMAMMSGARAVIPSLTTMGHPTYQMDTSAVHDGQLYVSRDPAVSLVELFTHSGVPLSIPTGSDVAATEAAVVTDRLSVSAVRDPLGQGEREEGSNETSGIVTDSDGSTNLVGSECSALLTQPGFARGMGTLVATTPPVASGVTHGPSPPKRSVSLTGKQTPKVSRASTNVSTSSSTATAGVTSTTANSGSDSSSVSIETGRNSFTTNGNRTGSLEKLGSFENGQETKGDSILTAIETDVYQGEVRASTLGRIPSSVTKEIAVELAPGSSATLPSSGSNPRSALKGADRTGPKVSKHLRFTTLTVITFMLLLAMVLGESRVNPDASRLVRGDRQNSRPGSNRAADPGISSTPDQSPPLVRWNVIRSFGSAGSDSSSAQSTNSGHYHPVEPWIRLTIWFPRHMLPEKSTSRPRKKSSGKSSTNSRKSPEKRGPESIQLWLNKTSHTEVHLASPIERSMVHIYGSFLFVNSLAWN
ncbi:hypothetical protein FGIG_04107 [Fasciola gigantica]|uniref:Uncharacterized protein n=1 Tax=Fasciola gigantica TaxID=46835 RepID=A0A504YK31_FASGI|nr:hypothetical protein FGIG_04107 [Fasciola gigantica]